jgi:8-oxo-dGTP diphosphatase
MKLLASIYPEDVDSSVVPADYSAFKTRPAGRAIVFDSEKVALIKVSKHDYYMLPGGGLDDDDIQAGVAREIREELGTQAKLDKEIGIIEVFFDRWQQKQVDYCFTAHLIHSTSEKALTDFEVEEGHEIVWVANVDEAIELVETAAPEQTDGKLVRARDLKFLQECKNLTQ